MDILKFSRILSFWMGFSFITYFFLNNTNHFFKMGPHSDLIIIGVSINNYFKYLTLLAYIIISIITRNIHGMIIEPWIILNIQNINETKLIYPLVNYYEIALISNVYMWFDWFRNLIMLFSQIDICIFDLSVDIIINLIVTRYYLNKKVHNSICEDNCV